MTRRNASPKRAGGRVTKTKAGVVSAAPAGNSVSDMVLVPGPKLRRMLGVSAVTLWRWRRDDGSFPTAKLINGRNYFPWADVQAWLARQQQAA